ncbi:MAG: GGDEF domain-containing protein [Chloroflexota bacterium]
MDILVLTSDVMERSVIQQVLQRSGHQVTFTHSIEDAWRRIKEGAFRFMILDAEAQEQGVHPLIEKVRSVAASIGRVYIMLLTSKGRNGGLVAALGVEADDYLLKPIAPQELKARVLVGTRILSMGDDLLQARNQMENLAMYDTLTGLLNRQAFYRVAQGELERARRLAQGISVIAMDVDNFKTINDVYGSAIGEEVLQIVSQVIREKSRPYDCIGRWEGDQFIVILPATVSIDAEKIARRILTSVQTSQISTKDGSALEVNLNAGIASTQNINAYVEIDIFIQSATQAMNASKKDKQEQISVVYI